MQRGSFGGASFTPSVRGSAVRPGSDAFSPGSDGGSVALSGAGFHTESSQYAEALQHRATHRTDGAEFASFRGLSEALGGLFNSATLSDVVIEAVEDPTAPSESALRIPAHRVVLAGWSSVWMRAMHDVDREQTRYGAREPVVRITRYPPKVIHQLVEFCYKGKTTVTLDTAIPLLAASRQFQIEELRRFCEDFCLHSMQATGVCSLHEAANKYSCRRLAEATLSFIIENGEESLGSRDSVSLSKESLLAVLKADDLVCEESTVFNCCARWVRAAAAQELGPEGPDLGAKADAQEARLQVERELFHDFTDLIRYPKIDADTLRDTVVPSGLVKHELLMEALLHHAAPRQALDSPMLNARFRQRKAPSIGRLQWSVQHSSRRIAIQDLDSVGSMEDTDAWRCLVSDMVFNLSSTRFDGSGERHYWEVEITNTAECNVMIGVCRPDAKVGETGAYTTTKGWCYFARDGKAYHSNEPKTFGTYNNPAQSGDRIGIMLNEEGTEPGTITFFKNGERLGVAFSNVTGELRPCVDLFDYGDRVRMLNTSHP